MEGWITGSDRVSLRPPARRGSLMTEVVRFEDYSYAYPESARFVLRNIDLVIRPGECHCLGGPTGSGKTSLALAVKGLLPPGTVRGSISCLPKAQTKAGGLGIVLQNPETQLLTRTVGAEVAFGLENQCVAPAIMGDRVQAALHLVGLEKPLDTDTRLLSMGEKYRLLLACQLAMAPDLLILDEPAAQLDPPGLETLAGIVNRLKNAGIAQLLCDNRPGPLQEAIDHHWHLSGGGRLCPGILANNRECRRRPEPGQQMTSARPADKVLQVSELTVAGRGETPVCSEISFSVEQGQRVVLYGPNGAGKTTILRCLSGFTRPLGGAVRIFGDSPEPARLRGRVGCLLQNPERQLFESTVGDEVAFALKRLAGNCQQLLARVAETLAMCGIEELAGASPHMLSYGQKHLVALASALAAAPQLLLLDDPLAGLDPARSDQVLALLARLNEEQGATLFLTSHNPGSLGAWPDQAFFIEGGNIVIH